MTGEVALEEPGRVAFAFAFGDASCDVFLYRGIVLTSVEGDGVQRAVQIVGRRLG